MQQSHAGPASEALQASCSDAEAGLSADAPPGDAPPGANGLLHPEQQLGASTTWHSPSYSQQPLVNDLPGRPGCGQKCVRLHKCLTLGTGNAEQLLCCLEVYHHPCACLQLKTRRARLRGKQLDLPRRSCFPRELQGRLRIPNQA